MKPSKLLFILTLPMTILVLPMTLSDDHPQQANTSFYVQGEELLYEASWSGIKIGTIRLLTLPDEGTHDVRHHAVAYIDSYSGLPFVNIHFIAYTEMDSEFNSLSSFSLEERNEDWLRLMYHYKFSEKKVIVEEAFQDDIDSRPHGNVVRDTIHLSRTPIQDGISLVFVARHLLQVREDRKSVV
jgi:hypothetical protein